MATCRRGRTGRLALVLSLALGVVLVAAAPAGAASGSIIKWNVFRGPLDDGYQCIAPAPGGVYAAGFTDGSSRDVLIAKNSSANLNLGSRWWDNPAAGGTDVAIAEAVDRFGNVAVAGSADGPASGAVNTDFLVLKMSRSSEPMWTAVLDGGAMAADAASDVVCDRDGNVYATGWRTATVGASFDYWTVKLDASDGHVVWQQFYNSGVGRSYGANAICLDAAGNVYVTGGAGSTDGGSDMVTVKYDNLGNQQWVVSTPGPVSGDDWGTHIALGRSGALFVAGTTPGAGGHDFLLARLTVTGDTTWVRTYDDVAHWDDLARELRVGPSNSPYVAGSMYSGNYSKSRGTIVRWSAGGDRLWARTWASTAGRPAAFNDMVLDAAGTAWCAGFMVSPHTGHDKEGLVCKYSSSGRNVWASAWEGPGRKDDMFTCLTLQGATGLFAAGSSAYPGRGTDAAIVKYAR